MEVRLLGWVGLWREGREHELARAHRRCVLAALALTPGQPVSSDALVDRIWGDQPPRAARRSLYSHVSVVRHRLYELAGGTGAVSLRTHDGGYLLEIDPELVDLHRARRRLDEVRRLPDNGVERDRRAAALLREASALWRGTPLAGLKGEWAARTRATLEQERLTLAIERFRLELRIGEHAAALAPLTELLTEHPLVEPLAGLLMLALYRCGRQADALDVYARTRQQLVEEIGDEPGAELRTLHEQVLRRDRALDLPADRVEVPGAPAAGSAAPAAGPDLPPAQLPPTVTGFTGRVADLARLDSALAVAGSPPGQVAIATVEGMAGVGKTALAVHWAHQVADRFPDGQLYLNLRGFYPGASPLSPAAALHRLLLAFQVPDHRIPADLDSLVGHYRTLLAERRVLVVLDNARDAEQVRPLLPAVAGCAAVVTSRNELSSLVAVEGAVPLQLELLPSQEARELLGTRLGRDRVAAEPVAVDALVRACAGLPLALAIVAARATARATFPLAVLADETRAGGAGLEPWVGPDVSTDLRAVFSWSYQALDSGAARMFRLLGLHTGPDLGAAAAANLAGMPLASARRLLSKLSDAHLLAERVPGRYVLHPLLRAYASELSHTVDTPADHRDALRRLRDYWSAAGSSSVNIRYALNEPRPPQVLG